MRPYTPDTLRGRYVKAIGDIYFNPASHGHKRHRKAARHSARQCAKREIQRQLVDSGPCQRANDAWWREHELDVSSSITAHLNREWEEAHEMAMESIRQQEYWDYEDERREYGASLEREDYDWLYEDSIL